MAAQWLGIEDYSPKFSFDVNRFLRSGRNTISVRATSRFGPPAIAVQLHVRLQDGSETVVTTDRSWRCRSRVPLGRTARGKQVESCQGTWTCRT